MRLDGLTEHLDVVDDDAALELPYGAKVYRVPAPGLSRGARCAAWLATSTIEDPSERAAQRDAILKDDSLSTLALTRAVVDELDADDVPAQVVQILTFTALVTWVNGVDAANAYVARLRAHDDNGGDQGKAQAGRRSASTSGRRTGSANRTRMVSTRTTGSRRSSSPPPPAA